MKKLIFGATVAAIAITGAAMPSHAERTVTEIVGYIKTETEINERDRLFAELDRNGDGVIDFKEFSASTVIQNKYEVFRMNDNDGDGVLSLQEFRDFSQQGPSKTTSNRGNFNQPSTRY